MTARRPSGPDFSLFPFLSVLLCVMGVLVVVLSGQTLLAMHEPPDQLIRIAGDAERSPRYVECREDEIVLHPEGRIVPSARLESELGEELRLMKARGEYLVLLIRPHGAATYAHCRFLAMSFDVEVGKDAILDGGQVVFDESGRAGVTPGGQD